MSAPSLLASTRKIVLRLFPQLGRIRIRPAAEGGALALGSASGRIELVGGAAAVGRVGDLVVRLAQDSLTGVLYVSTDDEDAPRTWSAVAAVVGVPIATDAGTRVAISAGSRKVTCG